MGEFSAKLQFSEGPRYIGREKIEKYETFESKPFLNRTLPRLFCGKDVSVPGKRRRDEKAVSSGKRKLDRVKTGALHQIIRVSRGVPRARGEQKQRAVLSRVRRFVAGATATLYANEIDPSVMPPQIRLICLRSTAQQTFPCGDSSPSSCGVGVVSSSSRKYTKIPHRTSFPRSASFEGS